MDTKLLYWNDAYAKTAKAVVIAVGIDWIEFDQTLFYPEGGGQPSDAGTISWNGGSAAVAVVKKEQGTIKHYVKGDVPIVGEQVIMEIDWNRRYALMRMHASQHLLSALVLDLFGASTVGNQIGIEKSRIDFHPCGFTPEQLGTLKEKFDQAVLEARPITHYEAGRKEVLEKVKPARRRLFERLPESIERIRVAVIEGYDECPCGGTHAGNTKEIGKLRILGVENKGKDKERITYTLV